VEQGLPPDVGFRRSSERAGEEVAFDREKGLTVSDLIATILDRAGGNGRTFRPSVLEQPSERELFKSTENAALGPAPEMLFRDVFAGAFPDLTQGRGPYEKFVAKQEGELENRFLGDVFRQFTQPGVIDTLRGDYESLYRTKERGDFEGTGGTIPAFEDFIKTRISGDYRSFLETEKPKLQQAFELAAPEERGQRDRGAIAPPKRIL